MNGDPPPGNVELLDEWDDDLPTPRRRTRTWLIGPLALVAVVAIVIAVVLGGTKPEALKVTSSPPAEPSATSALTAGDPSPTSWATVEASLPNGAVTYSRVDASGGVVIVGPVQEFTPDPIPSDAEAEPLLVTLLGKAEGTDPGIVAFKVQICLRAGSGAAGGGKVRISRSGWMLALASSSISPVSGGGLDPAFPDTALLGPGQCVSGYVTFPLLADTKYISLYYGDDRFTWSWRVS
jgi:hypothetical protein